MIINSHVDLQSRSVLLCASFPSGERGKAVIPYDVNAIADAVTAMTRAILAANGRIAFGGHPTITPLILLIASNRNERQLVDVYQSEWFDNEITPETRRLESLGYGKIHWTKRGESLGSSLTTLRKVMLKESNPLGAIFVGGMDGLFEEYGLFHREYPERPCIPVRGPGGAASRLDPVGVPRELAQQLTSLRYPFLSHAVVDFLGQQLDKQYHKRRQYGKNEGLH
jgi:hypothetical protein